MPHLSRFARTSTPHKSRPGGERTNASGALLAHFNSGIVQMSTAAGCTWCVSQKHAHIREHFCCTPQVIRPRGIAQRSDMTDPASERGREEGVSSASLGTLRLPTAHILMHARRHAISFCCGSSEWERERRRSPPVSLSARVFPSPIRQAVICTANNIKLLSPAAE